MSHDVLIRHQRRWEKVGVGHRQPKAGGFNLEFPAGVPVNAGTLLLMNPGTFKPGEWLRVFVTRALQGKGTQWFEVGRAFVSKAGAAFVVRLDVQIPAGIPKLVLLPPRRA